MVPKCVLLLSMVIEIGTSAAEVSTKGQLLFVRDAAITACSLNRIV